MKKLIVFLATATMAVAQNRTIEPGASITVRTNQTINASTSDHRVFTGVVDQDVVDRDGRVAIPRGSNVELEVRNVNNGELALDLDSVTVNGERYSLVADAYDSTGNDRRDGIGKNSRTGKYVGGGAVLGTIIGAIAGGGKGAAIGAASGAGAGAAAQIITRGKEVHVPAESVIRFRLDSPLRLHLWS